MKILITGGAGYLGSVITGRLLREGHKVTVLDKLQFKQVSLLPYCFSPNFEFVYGDVRNFNLLKKLVVANDVIIPLAAVVGFPACDDDPQLAYDLNYKQIVDIVSIIQSMNLNKKVLYPNTNSGYGIGEGQNECTEESPLTPISTYGKTKCDAENYLLEHLKPIVFRLATVFGVSPRMRTDLLVNEFVYKAMTDKYITVFEANFKRNFLHVQDVASVFSFMIDNYDKYKGQVFNVGLSDANLSKKELLEKIQEHISGFAVSYNDFYEDPDKRNYIVSNNKIESTGWRPNWTLDMGIQELIKAYGMIVPRMGGEFRNGFPLGYANKA